MVELTPLALSPEESSLPGLDEDLPRTQLRGGDARIARGGLPLARRSGVLAKGARMLEPDSDLAGCAFDSVRVVQRTARCSEGLPSADGCWRPRMRLSSLYRFSDQP